MELNGPFPFLLKQFQQLDKDMLEEGHTIVTIGNYVQNTGKIHKVLTKAM